MEDFIGFPFDLLRATGEDIENTRISLSPQAWPINFTLPSNFNQHGGKQVLDRIFWKCGDFGQVDEL